MGREGVPAEGLGAGRGAGEARGWAVSPALNPSESFGALSLLSGGTGGNFQELHHLNRTVRGRLNHTVLLWERIAIIHSVVTQPIGVLCVPSTVLGTGIELTQSLLPRN